jgi:hypothetical protein
VSERGWHVGRWGPLGWAETAVKGAAQVIGIVALARAAGDPSSDPGGLLLAQLVILGVLSLGLVAAIADRVMEREIISMAFVIPNNVAHWGMAYALATTPGPGRLLAVFCALMLAGEAIKLAFLARTGYRVRTASPGVVYGLTVFYAAGYAVILVLDALR